MEIKKTEKREPSYPAARIAAAGLAVLTVGALLSGMSGCDRDENRVQIEGGVTAPPIEDLLNYSGDVQYYSPEDEVSFTDDVSCTDAQCSDSDVIDLTTN